MKPKKITRFPYAGSKEMAKYAHRDSRGTTATGVDRFLFDQNPMTGPRREKPLRTRGIRRAIGKHVSFKTRRGNIR